MSENERLRTLAISLFTAILVGVVGFIVLAYTYGV